MTDIGTTYATLGSPVTNSTSTFAEVVETSALVSGTTYYVICHALVEGSTSLNLFETRLLDRTNSDAVVSDSLVVRKYQDADQTQSYTFIGKVTAGSSGGGLELQQRATTVGSVTTQYVSMLLLDLSSLADTDYFFAEDATNATQTSSFVRRLNHEMTDSDSINGNTWLVLAWANFNSNVNNRSLEMKLVKDQDVDTEDPLIRSEAVADTEFPSWLLVRPYTFTSGNTVAFGIETRDDGTTFTHNEYLSSSMLGIRLGAFENSSSNWDETPQTTTSTDWQQRDSQSFTPTNSGDVIVLGSSSFDLAGTTGRVWESAFRFQLDGTTQPNTIPDSEWSVNGSDQTDLLPMFYILKYSGTGATATTIDIDAKHATTGDAGWQDLAFAAFTTQIASVIPITYSSVAAQTYNGGVVVAQSNSSGDVASKTYSANDQASEVN